LADVCNTIQQDLTELIGNQPTAAGRESVGFLEAVVSPENTASQAEQVQIDAGDGKIKKVIVRYLNAGSEDAVNTDESERDICAFGDADAFNFKEVNVGLYADIAITFTDDQMRRFCDAPAADRARIIATKMNPLFLSMNKQLIAKANTVAGNFYNGVAPGKTVPMLFTSTGGMVQSNPAGEVTILEDMSDLSVVGTPIVVGAGKLSQYARFAGIGCCNDYGQNIAATGGFSFYRDRFLGGVTGNADDFLAFAPGALQFVSWNRYKGDFAVQNGASFKTTIIDPVTGIELDLNAKYDDCNERWVFTFSKNFDLFTMPDDVFGSTDPRDGVNYLFKYRAACGAGDFCGNGEGEGGEGGNGGEGGEG
jgi:hypothetical protein